MNAQEIKIVDLQSAQSRDPKAWKVAQDFEAMFIQQMMTAMRKTVLDGGMTDPSRGREIFTSMLDEEMSKSASKQGSFGMAEIIYRQLKPGDRTPSSLNAYAQHSMPGRAASWQVDAWITEAADANQVDENLLRSLVKQESAGDSLARSQAGAQGLTQLMPATAKEMGVVNPWDGRQNLMGGARYLKQMLQRFDGREDLALAAYNAGPAAVEKHGGIPPFAETQNYVKKVLEGRNQNQRKNMEVEYARR